MSHIQAAIHNAETQNVQLLAKVSSLDLSLAEHKTLNHSLLQQVGGTACVCWGKGKGGRADGWWASG